MSLMMEDNPKPAGNSATVWWADGGWWVGSDMRRHISRL